MSYTLAYKGAEIDDILGRAAPGGALDTAIAAKQDVLTFDDTPESGSDNPVKSGGIYDAIQAGGAAALAAFPTDTVSGDVVSFPDVADGIPVKSFVGSIIPQQNLNGQASPYPAGGGKNKVGKSDGNTGTLTRSGVTFKFEDDGSVTLNGTATAAIYPCLFDSTGATIASNSNWHGSSSRMPLTSGTYKFTATITGTGLTASSVTLAAYDGETQRLINGAAAANTIDGVNSVFLSIANGTAFSNCNIKWQLESGSTATAYAPYANICPISGWTGANIYRMGANLWDGEWEQGRINYQTGQNEANSSEWRTKNYIPIKPNTSYYCYAATANKSINARFYDIDKNYIGYTAATGSVVTGAAFTTPANAYFMRYAPVTATLAAGSVSINYPSTQTGFVAYAGAQTILLDFGQTVYAGTLTALGGGLWSVQPTHAIMDLSTASYTINTQTTGKLFNFAKSDMSRTAGLTGWAEAYKQAFVSAARDMPDYSFLIRSDANAVLVRTDGTETTLPTGNLVYPLATLPDPITITGEDLQTLLGANTVWQSAGSITSLEYRADTALYIQKLLNGGGTLQTLSMASPSPSLSLGRVGVLAEPEVSEPEEVTEEPEADTEEATEE